MIKTERFAQLAEEFQDRRHKLAATFERDIEALEPFKGSGGYMSDMKARTDRYRADLDNLKHEYEGSLYELIDQMDTSLHSRKYEAPTEEQLRLLQTVQMQERPSHGELLRVAEAVKDNPVALQALQDMANAKASARDELPHDYIGGRVKEMPLETAERHLRELRAGLRDFLDHDTKKVARIAAKQYERHYGDVGVTIPRRDHFDNPEGCFAEICRMDAGTYDAFSAVVDF